MSLFQVIHKGESSYRLHSVLVNRNFAKGRRECVSMADRKASKSNPVGWTDDDNALYTISG
jgi:hypothetical protein